MSSQPSAGQTATVKERFDLGIAMLKGYYDGLETRAERTAVLMVGVVGWFTSDSIFSRYDPAPEGEGVRAAA